MIFIIIQYQHGRSCSKWSTTETWHTYILQWIDVVGLPYDLSPMRCQIIVESNTNLLSVWRFFKWILVERLQGNVTSGIAFLADGLICQLIVVSWSQILQLGYWLESNGMSPIFGADRLLKVLSWANVPSHYGLLKLSVMPQSHPTTDPVRFLSPVRFLARKAEWSARRNFTSVLFSWSH